MRFRFIEDRRADYPVTVMCGVLGVSPAGYYAWRSRPESRRSTVNRELVGDIQLVHRNNHGRYGSPRIHAELQAQGRGVSRGRIERLMRHHGIHAVSQRVGLRGCGFIAPSSLGPGVCIVLLGKCGPRV